MKKLFILIPFLFVFFTSANALGTMVWADANTLDSTCVGPGNPIVAEFVPGTVVDSVIMPNFGQASGVFASFFAQVGDTSWYEAVVQVSLVGDSTFFFHRDTIGIPNCGTTLPLENISIDAEFTKTEGVIDIFCDMSNYSNIARIEVGCINPSGWTQKCENTDSFGSPKEGDYWFGVYSTLAREAGRYTLTLTITDMDGSRTFESTEVWVDREDIPVEIEVLSLQEKGSFFVNPTGSKIDLQIYNLQGKLIMRVPQVETGVVKICRPLPTGIYLIGTGDTDKLHKVLIQ